MKAGKQKVMRHHGYMDRKYVSNGIKIGANTRDKVTYRTKKTTLEERILTYRFYTHFHPYVKELIRELINGSVPALQAADTDYLNETLPNGRPKPRFYQEFFKAYSPDATLIPAVSEGSDQPLHPVKDIDFSSSGAYSVYNWELFFHVPLTIAMHLSKNQRYEEAMKWFHYIFDPGDDSTGPTPERFWRVKPFQQTEIKKIEEIMVNLSSEADSELFADTVNSIEAWKNSPFRPHVIARYRHSAYMLKTVMAYLDNLIEWGDSLFLQDTGETIDEANMLYTMAENILGPKPQAVPKKGSVKTQTYASMRADLDEFGNVLREMEVDIPFDLAPVPTPASTDDEGKMQTLVSIGSSLYFCIPRNNKLLGYWDTVADRRYKIHNSLNLQGVFRQLPLFEPEIDPGLLAQGAAAGLDISAIVNGLNQPLPLVRFKHMLQKANEICQEVKAMGSALLATIEKEDGEALSLIRAKHDTKIQQLAEGVRYAQWQEAIKAKETLEVSLKNAITRYTYYEKLLGNPDINVPKPAEFDKSGMDKQKFTAEDQEIEKRDISYDLFSEALDAAGLGDLNALRLNTPEAMALILDASTMPLEAGAMVMDVIGSIITMIPEFTVRVTPIGVGGGVSIKGEQLGRILQMMSSATRGGESIVKTLSGLSSSVAGHMRRRQEWESQSQQACGEINSVYKQLLGAKIREYIAKKEYDNHKVQLQQTLDIEDFLNGEKVNGFTKSATHGFYAFLKREVKSLHNKYFKFAFDVAKKAERALQHELGNPELSFIQFNYMAGKEGLYAGEKLAFDLKKMEMAYYDMNARELELVKHISVAQISPAALLQLRLTGRCTVSIPEEVFDIGGCEGHYFRRIKTVALSMPCIAGPYTSINCTLTLTKSSIRKKSGLLDNEYSRQENDTERFSDHHGTTSIVTSSAQNDRGMFDFNMNDERYLPFEYAGVISEWQLELAADFRQFDYMTISDVVFHISYTARQAGGLLKTGAIDNLRKLIAAQGTTRMFSLKYEFPTEWHNFISGSAVNNFFPLTFDIKESHYPYWSRGFTNKVKEIELHAISDNPVTVTTPADTNKTFQLVENPELTRDIYPGKKQKIQTKKWDQVALPASPKGTISLLLDRKDISDIWVMMRWSN